MIATFTEITCAWTSIDSVFLFFFFFLLWLYSMHLFLFYMSKETGPLFIVHVNVQILQIKCSHFNMDNFFHIFKNTFFLDHQQTLLGVAQT